MERNRLIDGWRGVSVTLVIFGHLVGFRFSEYFQTEPFLILLGGPAVNAVDLAKNIILRVLSPLQILGVDVFFIISGYLITKLLINEEDAQNSISIKAFYIRRVCRIIPAFYTYLATIFFLSACGVMEIPRHAFIWSGLFLCDVPGASCPWLVTHTWSLSVEEQFYLAWPLIFVMLGKGWRTAGLGLILASLLSISFFNPIALSFSYIAIGGLFASSAGVRGTIIRFASGNLIVIAAIIIFLQPFFASFPSGYNILNAARPALLAIIFFGTINGVGPFVRMVSMEWLRRIGLVSYSVYLWQQFSTGTPNLYGAHAVLLIPALFIGPAILSYILIEQPIIRVGHRLSASITGRPRSSVHPKEPAR